MSDRPDSLEMTAAPSDSQSDSGHCVQCSERPRLGALSRCKPCLKADTARDRNQRGHGAKIEAAALRLWPDGKVPSWLRPVDVFRRLESELKQMGCTATEMPSESSFKRWHTGWQAEISITPSDVCNAGRR
jgi:hypothetical protein